jgi:hypothetical protein
VKCNESSLPERLDENHAIHHLTRHLGNALTQGMHNRCIGKRGTNASSKEYLSARKHALSSRVKTDTNGSRDSGVDQV